MRLKQALLLLFLAMLAVADTVAQELKFNDLDKSPMDAKTDGSYEFRPNDLLPDPEIWILLKLLLRELLQFLLYPIREKSLPLVSKK